jgi:hypothetical protein
MEKDKQKVFCLLLSLCLLYLHKKKSSSEGEIGPPCYFISQTDQLRGESVFRNKPRVLYYFLLSHQNIHDLHTLLEFGWKLEFFYSLDDCSNPMIFFFLSEVIQAQKQCYFPAWLQLHPRWHTLDRRTIFTFNSSMMTSGNGSVVGEVTTDGNSQAKTTIAGVCSEIVENPSPDEFMLVLHTTSAQW